MSRRCAASIAVLAVSFLGGAAATAAPPDALRLSLDGVTWAPTIDVPLLDPTHVWVPGDAATVAFWAENHTSDEASLTVDFAGSDVPTLLDAPGASLTAVVDGSSRTIDVDADARLVEIDRLLPEQRTRITLTFVLDAATGNDAQRIAAPVRLRVTLSEAGPGVGSPVVGPTLAPPIRQGSMPTTGVGLQPVLVAAGAVLLLGVGAARLGRVRRGH